MTLEMKFLYQSQWILNYCIEVPSKTEKYLSRPIVHEVASSELNSESGAGPRTAVPNHRYTAQLPFPAFTE